MILQNNNFLLIDKPAGWTSFDAVNFLRAKLRKEMQQNVILSETKNPLNLVSQPYSRDPSLSLRMTNRVPKIRVGHAGTLDPFATGLLIVAVGRENTKRIDEFKKLPKTYVATIHLGATSDTQDSTGTILFVIARSETTKQSPGQGIASPTARNDIEATLKTFIGKQLQTPPMFSAKKIAGQRLYKLARQGKEIKREPVEIEIYDIKLLEYNWPFLKIEVQCSSGTYIRTLATDIGTKLDCGAYCQELRRTAIGPYHVDKAEKIAKTP